MLDTIKHLDVFDTARFNDRGGSCSVVGAGAVGSAIVLHLAKLGIERITVIDGDRVEGHNIANQIAYGPQHIGEHKVACLAETVGLLTGTVITTIPRMVEPDLRRNVLPGEHLFMAVDSMAVRRMLLDNQIAQSPTVKFFYDARMGTREWRLYGRTVGDREGIDSYTADLYSDDEVAVDVGGCGITQNIGATAATVAACAVWTFMHAVQRQKDQLQPALDTTTWAATDPWQVHFSARQDAR